MIHPKAKRRREIFDELIALGSVPTKYRLHLLVDKLDELGITLQEYVKVNPETLKWRAAKPAYMSGQRRKEWLKKARKGILRISADGERKEYESICEAAKDFDVHYATQYISQALRRQYLAFGYAWFYIE